jgi:hypothetical protein
MVSDATGARHGTWFLRMSSHFACWLNIESMTCAKASVIPFSAATGGIANVSGSQ